MIAVPYGDLDRTTTETSSDSLDDLVVIGIVLESAARVDSAHQPNRIRLAHESPRGVGLVFQTESRVLRLCCVRHCAVLA